MKLWSGRLLIILFGLSSFQASASQVKGVKAYLDFDQDYQEPRERISQSRLALVIGETRYSVLSDEQEKKFEAALSLLEETLNSEEFKKMVLSYKRSDGERLYQNNHLWGDETSALSNEDVYNIIKAGNEKMVPGTIGEMNIYSWIKKCTWRDLNRKWCNGVIGSTDPRNSEWIKLNYAFYRKFDAPTMVNNLVHEWIHLLGFLHGSEKLGEEAPYVIGEIAEKVSRKILKNRN